MVSKLPQARHLVHWLLQEDALHRPQSWADVLRHPFLAEEDPNHRVIVMSCPEHGTLDPNGGPPYNQSVMDKVNELQQRGRLKGGFDRAGSSNSDARDAETWPKIFKTEREEQLYEEDDAKRKGLIKSTYWFAGYQSAAKAQMKLECQSFDGTLEVICIQGGAITDAEHEEVRVNIIGHARIRYVGNYQSCMV